MEQLGLSGLAQPAQRRRTWRFWLLVLSPALFLSMCGLFGIRAFKLNGQVQGEATTFHKRKESGDFDVIYDTGSRGLQRATTLDQFTRYMNSVREKMGACEIPAKALTSFANANTAQTTVKLTYHSKCANGALDEVIVFVEEDGTPRLLSYRASSPFD